MNSQPLPSSSSDFQRAIEAAERRGLALGLEAARVEFFATNALLESNRSHMTGFTDNLRSQLSERTANLTGALDHEPPPPIPEEVRAALRDMGEPLRATLAFVQFGDARLRDSIAAAITYSEMLGSSSVVVDPPGKTR